MGVSIVLPVPLSKAGAHPSHGKAPSPHVRSGVNGHTPFRPVGAALASPDGSITAGRSREDRAEPYHQGFRPKWDPETSYGISGYFAPEVPPFRPPTPGSLAPPPDLITGWPGACHPSSQV